MTAPPRKLRFDVRASGRQIALAIGAGLALNAAAYGGLVRPRVQEVERLERESQPRLEQVKRREAEVRAKESFVEGLETASRDLASLRQDVLSTKRQRMIAVQLEIADLAEEFDITIERIQNQNDILEDEGLERFGMKVPLKGGYGSLRKFLQAVEASDQFLVIEEVALEDGKDGGLLELNITVATYFDAPQLRPEPKAAAAGDGRRGA
jgi:Tfp pilus assembly protein PilO